MSDTAPCSANKNKEKEEKEIIQKRPKKEKRMRNETKDEKSMSKYQSDSDIKFDLHGPLLSFSDNSSAIFLRQTETPLYHLGPSSAALSLLYSYTQVNLHLQLFLTQTAEPQCVKYSACH